MRYSDQEIELLLEKWLNKTATADDEQQLAVILKDYQSDPVVLSSLKKLWGGRTESFQEEETEFARNMVDAILKAVPAEKEDAASVRVHRVHFLRTAWFRYAAAIILLLGVGGYFLWSDRGEIPAGGNDKGSAVRMQSSNNNNKAILTLASGKKVELENTKTPLLVKEGAVFDPREAGQKPGVASYNTITTPKGGQYQIILPDGSKVWLNAVSSIKFPTAFTGTTRTVEITGEAYLEIAKNSRQPFFVKALATEVQVLGTAFNINAYSDENAIKTTLIAGSVKVMKFGREVMLSPGQQAVVTSLSEIPGELGQLKNDDAPNARDDGRGDIKVRTINTDQVIAWKNGMFNFEGLGLKEVVNQLQRWYDIQVIYENGIPDITLFGEMNKSSSLSAALEVLKVVGVQFRMEGKKLIISK